MENNFFWYEKNGIVIVIAEIFEVDKPSKISKRVYNKNILDQVIFSTKENIENRGLLGTLDFPSEGIISMSRVSHLVSRIWADNGKIMTKLEILETPQGNSLKSMVKSGAKLNFHAAGIGTYDEKDGLSFVDGNYKFITVCAIPEIK